MLPLMPLLLGLLAGLSTATPDIQPAYDLISRVFGERAAAVFSLSLDANATCRGKQPPCFGLSADASRVSLTASSMSELTYGIGYYTRFHCGLTVGWKRGGGSHTSAGSWPCHVQSSADRTQINEAVARAVAYTYEDNVCTHSYSYVWYDEARWTAHIDWMALSGINVFLALTGQEEIQYKAFRRFNLSDTQIREFFNGPAYLTWSRGQDLQSVGAAAMPEGGGSGLPRSWMQSQWKLQKTILSQTRALGIIGVLPAFQGNLPPQIKALHPTANISVVSPRPPRIPPGDGTPDSGGCAWIASTDPLFGQVADAWMQIMLEDFGTDHWYQCDGFFTGAKPPWYEAPEQEAVGRWDGSAPIEPDQDWAPVWAAAWSGMARTDPAARWLYQGWAIRGWHDAAGASRIRALYEAVPHGQWIPLDMDVRGIWRYFGNYSFFGEPFIWTTLHNMGGNDGLKGDMRLLASIPTDALDARSSIIGTGATPEGINQNPPYYEYTYDTAWHTTPQLLSAWFETYSSRRYGNTANAQAAAAWDILSTTVYNSQAGGWHDDTGVEWNGLSNVPTAKGINITALFQGWQLLIQAGASVGHHYDTLNYDIVNVGREILAQLITQFQANLTAAVIAIDKQQALSIADTLLSAYKDIDELVGCDEGFLLGAWIADAKKWANGSDAPASYYEWQARSQVSAWWPVAPSDRKVNATYTKLPSLDNYANKHWNGLIRDFYARRVQCYINQIAVDLPDVVPQTCHIQAQIAGTYLAGYPRSLGCSGASAPSSWPYNTSNLGDAKMWCCTHEDCGGITQQNNQYEVRASGTPTIEPGSSPQASSYPRAGRNLHLMINTANLTRCVVTAEMDFTQATDRGYATEATTGRTHSLSAQLLAKYKQHI